MTDNFEHFTWFANLLAELLNEETAGSIEKKAKIIFYATLYYDNDLNEDQRKDLFFYMLGTMIRSKND